MMLIITNIMFLDIIHWSSCLYLKHRPVYFPKHSVSETGFCLRLQAKPTQLGPIDKASLSPYNVLDKDKMMDNVQKRTIVTNF
jgi:hypothetical protein